MVTANKSAQQTARFDRPVGLELSILQAVARVAATATDLVQVTDACKRELSRVYPLERVMIAAPDRERGRLAYLSVAQGSIGPSAGMEFPYEGSNVAWVVEHAKPLVQPDTREPIVPFDEVQVELGVGSYVTVPILGHGKVLAVLGVGSGSPNTPWCHEVELLGLVAGQVASSAAYTLIQDGVTLVGHREELLAVVAHEMKTPLSVLSGYLSLAPELASDEAATRDMYDGMARAARRLAVLVNDLVAHTSFETGEVPLRVETCDLGELVRSAAAELSLQDCVVVDGDYLVRGDADRLHQVVTNLLTNAIKHGRPPISARVHGSQGTVSVTVTDGGEGFPASVEQRLFTKYASHGSSRGMGLGLWVAHRIVELHHGTIGARNGARGGAEIVVTIPAAAVEAAAN